MREARRWFPVYVRKNEAGKWDKKPAVEWSKSENWKTYAELEAEQALGFALGDGFFGIDMDDCLDDAGAVKPERKELVNDVLEKCPSFTEVSWSGKGLHVYGYARMPAACKDATPGLELYSEKRFFLVTGRPFDVDDLKPIKDIQVGVEKLYAQYGRPAPKPAEATPGDQMVGEGHRSNEIFSRASTLYKLGYSAKAVMAAMLVWNREHCRPPLPDEAVAKQCQDRYPAERFPIEETEEQKTEILTYEKIVETAAVNLVEFCENKRYVATGFRAVDGVLGRLPAGSMTIIGGETGSGKSHLVHAIALNAQRAGNKPGIISLEDGVDEWGTRGIAILTGCTYKAVLAAKVQSREDRAVLYEQIYEAPDKAKGIDIKIGFAVAAQMETVIQTAKSLISDHGRDVLLVDYAQAVRVESDRVRLDKAYADVAKRLKGLCAKHKIPLVLNSQLTRSKDAPTISSLKESGDLENEAEIVMLLWRERNKQNPRTLWRIGKAKWCGEQPEGYVKFGIGGAIEDLVTEDTNNAQALSYLD
jgi:replicative DNA helicase